MQTSFTSHDGHSAEQQTICDRFRQSVDKYPDNVAVKSNTQEFTYNQLNAVSNRIAHTILHRAGEGLEPVVVIVGKGPDAISVLLGLLKAGKIYAPIDPTFPRKRIHYMLADLGAKTIVCDNSNLALAKELNGVEQLINIDDIGNSVLTDPPNVPVKAADSAWILYTSGSTGQPKGVVQTHRNAVHYVDIYKKGMQISEFDKLSMLYSCAVNGGIHEVLTAILNGASLFFYTIQVDGINGIGKWLTEHGLTIYSSVPTVFRHFARSLSGSVDFSALRYVKLIGEPVYKGDVELFQSKFPRSCTLINRLGSSETGTIRWNFINHQVKIDGNNVPVGYAVEHNDVFLVGRSGAKAEIGEIGEIAVRSQYLSPGYWSKPDVTNKVFFPDPNGGEQRIYLTGDMGRMSEDGCLVCLGRKDSQIKILGYRIEASEIEKALLDTGSIKDAVVVGIKQKNQDQQLVAYVVLNPAASQTGLDLRQSLVNLLPAYMIPTRFVFMDSLPTAPNGKVDRRSLPPPDKVMKIGLNSDLTPPSTLIEQHLAQIWCDVLGLERLSICDHFLQLGGDSLKAARIAARVFDHWEIEISVSDLLAESTVQKMSQTISSALMKKN